MGRGVIHTEHQHGWRLVVRHMGQRRLLTSLLVIPAVVTSVALVASGNGNEPGERRQTGDLATFLDGLHRVATLPNWVDALMVQCVERAASPPVASDAGLPLPMEIRQSVDAWMRAVVNPAYLADDTVSKAIGLLGWAASSDASSSEREDAVVVAWDGGDRHMFLAQTLGTVCLVISPSDGRSLAAPAGRRWLHVLNRSIWPEVGEDGQPIEWLPGQVVMLEGRAKSALGTRRDERTGLTAHQWVLGSDYPFALSVRVVADQTGCAVVALRKRYGSDGATYRPPTGSCLDPASPLATAGPWYGDAHANAPVVTPWETVPVEIEYYADPQQFGRGHYGDPFLVLGALPPGATPLALEPAAIQSLRIAALAQIRRVLPPESSPDGVARLLSLHVTGEWGSAAASLHYRTKYQLAIYRLAVWGTLDDAVNVYVEAREDMTLDVFDRVLSDVFGIHCTSAPSRVGNDWLLQTERARISTVHGYRREFDLSAGRDAVRQAGGLVARFRIATGTDRDRQ